MWALSIFACEFGLVMVFSIIFYAIWRSANPEKKW